MRLIDAEKLQLGLACALRMNKDTKGNDCEVFRKMICILAKEPSVNIDEILKEAEKSTVKKILRDIRVAGGIYPPRDVLERLEKSIAEEYGIER